MRAPVAVVLLAAALAADASAQSHRRQVVCACVKPSCHFAQPVGGGWIYEPEKLEGDPPERSSLPAGSPTGYVILEVRIDEHGCVTGTCVRRGVSAGVDAAAAAAVKRWRYEPAALAKPQDGRPIGTPIPIAITVAVPIGKP